MRIKESNLKALNRSVRRSSKLQWQKIDNEMEKNLTDRINTIAQLEQLCGEVKETSIKKELPYIHDVYRPMITASPFFVLATSGEAGLDASPRGDPAGFVQIQDAQTLLLPERRGNNRVDSLRNIIEDPRVALLFMIPGVAETLRVNGVAKISVAPDLLTRFLIEGKPPKCVIVVAVKSVYFQCGRALIRSQLWDASTHQTERPVPSTGTMLAALTDAKVDAAAYDRDMPSIQRSSLY
jgi:uncharacterized protein